ncbi:MAG: insulinase family protein [Alphaproteobacteria bacterium]|nr:insulinase family protein [Alphaproteobacteria bacterium]
MIALSVVLAASAADVKRPEPVVAAAVTRPDEEGAGEAEGEPTGPDRSHPPEVAPPPVLELPEPEVHALHPGVQAWYVRVPGVRKVSVEVVFDRGMVELSHKPDMVGRATGWLADAAGGDMDGAAFSAAEDLREIDVWSDLGQHDGTVGMTAPREELTEGLRLMSLVLREPGFPKQEVKRWVLDQRQFYLIDAPSSQGILANSGLGYGWFEPGHPYGARPQLAELDGVKDKALDAMWGRLLHEAPATVIVVGDVAWGDVEPALISMTEGIGTEGPATNELLFDPPTETRVLAVDLPGQAQSAVRARIAAPTRGDEDSPAMVVANWVYGGHFQSRLNSNLREEKGWTYGSRSSYSAQETFGHVTISVDVQGPNTGATIGEIEKELARMVAEPVTEEELEAAHRSLVADWNRFLETADSAAGLYSFALDHHETAASLRERQERVYAATGEQVQAVSARWLAADRPRLWVVVGDRKTIEPQLTEMGLPVHWVAPADMALGKL